MEGATNNVLCKAGYFLIRAEDKYIHSAVNVWKRFKKIPHVYTNIDPGPQVEWVCTAMEMPFSSQCHHSFLKLMNCLINIVKVKVLVPQSCPALCSPVDCSPPGSPVPGILQTRILEWVAILFSRGSFWPKDRIQVSCIAGRFFTIWASRIHIK